MPVVIPKNILKEQNMELSNEIMAKTSYKAPALAPLYGPQISPSYI